MAGQTKARRPKASGQSDIDVALAAHEAARAIQLATRSREAATDGIIYVVGSEAKIHRMARLLWSLASDVEALIFPPWDCLPYDRSPPSSRAMGLRVAALSWLAAGPTRPWLLITTSEGLIQRAGHCGAAAKERWALRQSGRQAHLRAALGGMFPQPAKASRP
jgi:transcription-repair coupling factor (superfamily II helicase)